MLFSCVEILIGKYDDDGVDDDKDEYVDDHDICYDNSILLTYLCNCSQIIICFYISHGKNLIVSIMNLTSSDYQLFPYLIDGLSAEAVVITPYIINEVSLFFKLVDSEID